MTKNNGKQGKFNIINSEIVNNEIHINKMNKEKCYWKIVFIAISIIIFSSMMYIASQAGSGGDDVWYGTNGYFVLNYYLDGDTSCLDYSKIEYHNMTPNGPIKYFAGAGFEIFPSIVIRAFHIDNELLVRRFFLALFGFLLILFTGLIGKRIKNWKLASLAMLLMALTPIVLGLSFCGGQDVPSALGFAIAIYGLLIFTDKLPKISIKGLVFTFLGILLATSVRISGLVLLLYFFFAVCLEFLLRKDLRNLFLQKKFVLIGKIAVICLVIGLSAALLGLCAYPNIFHEGVIAHIKSAFGIVSQFFVRIPFVFEGKIAESNNPPENYLLKSLAITLPYYIFMGALLFIFFIRRVYKNYKGTAILFILFAMLFPPLYITYTDANIYNGWRHILFFYAPAAVLVSVGWYELFAALKPKNLKEKVYVPIVAVIMLVVVSPTLIWVIKNHNYIYSYYNKSIGNPYLKYELDYYETSATKSYDWLRENELNKTDSLVKVSTKIFTPVYYAEMLGDTNHIKVFRTSFMGFAETDCDYSIINYHIIPPKIVKKFFPPKGTIHIEEVDGNPICAVVKRNKFDSHGIQLIKERKFSEGMALLEKAYAFDENNFGIWLWMGYGYYYTHNYQKAIEFFNKLLSFGLSEEEMSIAYMYNGASYVNLEQYDQAIASLRQAEQMASPNDKIFIAANMGVALYYTKDYKNAARYLQTALPSYPQLANMLNNCNSNN